MSPVNVGLTKGEIMLGTEWLAGIVIPIVSTALRPTPVAGEAQSLDLSKMAPRYIDDRRTINLRNIDLGGRLDAETRWYLAVFAEMCGSNDNNHRSLTKERATHLSTRLRVAHKMCDEAGLRLVDVINSYARQNRMMRVPL
jgi:hypothetical protein